MSPGPPQSPPACALRSLDMQTPPGALYTPTDAARRRRPFTLDIDFHHGGLYAALATLQLLR